jgi:leucyl-tRNA synthetase
VGGPAGLGGGLVTATARGRAGGAADASEQEVKDVALKLDNVVRHVEGKTIVKVVVIPGKLVSVVVK